MEIKTKEEILSEVNKILNNPYEDVRYVLVLEAIQEHNLIG